LILFTFSSESGRLGLAENQAGGDKIAEPSAAFRSMMLPRGVAAAAARARREADDGTVRRLLRLIEVLRRRPAPRR
jgi:hypothetical protein